jgi:hypothetical protein
MGRGVRTNNDLTKVFAVEAASFHTEHSANTDTIFVTEVIDFLVPGHKIVFTDFPLFQHFVRVTDSKHTGLGTKEKVPTNASNRAVDTGRLI